LEQVIIEEMVAGEGQQHYRPAESGSNRYERLHPRLHCCQPESVSDGLKIWVQAQHLVEGYLSSHAVRQFHHDEIVFQHFHTANS
jgi:hypothetical protein